MRTTLNTIYNNIQSNLDRITTSMNKINQRISSGLQMSTISDNPVNLVSALRYRTTISELGQYNTNITYGSSIINSSEDALTQMKSLATSAKTLAIQASDPALNSANLDAIADQIDTMLQQAVELGNTQINGEFIFGGQRTSGYTATEPAPFVTGQGNGYWVNGAAMTPLDSKLTGSPITPAATSTDLAAGDLLINSTDVGAVDLTTAPDVNGINMAGADNLKTAINGNPAFYTYANNAATAATADSSFSFNLNNIPISVSVSAGANATTVANATITAINAQTAASGVTAVLGDGTNGGPVNSVVFKNAQAGDDSTITVSNFTTSVNGGANPGFGDFSKKVVIASLTTQTAGAAVAAGAAGGEVMDFSINGTRIAYTLTAGTPTQTAQQTVDAINQASQTTGVTAQLGNGNNGGPADSVVLTNTQAGDESDIVLTDLTPGAGNEGGLSGLTDGTYSVGAANNNGRISLSSAASIDLTTSGATAPTPNDTILNLIGLGGGNKGNYDQASDGALVYGYPLSSGDLKINGIEVPATASDGNSDIYSAASADAKATAINAITSQTGVTAVADPAQVAASGAVNAGTEATRLTGTLSPSIGTLPAAGLTINSIALNNDINIGAVTQGLSMAEAFNARTEINNITNSTGVTAKLTTLYAGAAATAPLAQPVSFDVNGISVSLTTGGVSGSATAADVVDAINAVSDQTGVEAQVGDGTNGGIPNSVVLNNIVRGNENDITISGAPALTGLTDGTYSADATHNTGQVSFESDSPFTISGSPTSIIKELGLSTDSTIGTVNYGSTPKYLSSGDLKINGVDIFPTPTAVSAKDSTNSLLDAINSKTASTGVKATRGKDGTMQLAAIDGRNIHIQTSINGEDVTKINGNSGNLDEVYFGGLKLESDRQFTLQTVDPSVNSTEPGLEAIGMAGGSAVTGEPTDTAGDGKIDVFSIHDQTGTVRYNGDRIGDLNIKIGKTSTMKVGDNGQTSVADTSIFTTVQSFADALRGLNFTTVTGAQTATDTSQLLNSKKTGLEPDSQLPNEDLFSTGSFTVTVNDHNYEPPKASTISIGVDPTVDTLDSVAQRINGIPNMSASWNADGQLEIKSTDPSRYTISLDNDSSNFLKATGVDQESMQQQGISQAMDNLDNVMNNMTEQISNSGARANRIDIQTKIYSQMTTSTQGNLSEVQDTDMIQAVMDLTAKQTAYQAALSAASKTMQLSLVDYL